MIGGVVISSRCVYQKGMVDKVTLRYGYLSAIDKKYVE